MRLRLVWPLVGLAALVAFALEAGFLPDLMWHDALVATWFAARRGCSPGVDVALLTDAAPYLGVAFVVIGLGLGLARRAPLADLAWALVLLGAGLLFVESLKVLFERARPDVRTWKPAGDAFPSGHVANIVLCVGTAIRLVPRCSIRRQDVLRLALALGGLAAIAAVAFSRLYLDRHWLSDVLGSVLLGAAFLGLTCWRTTAGRITTFFALMFVTSGLFLTAASGARITLASPSLNDERLQFQLPLARAHARTRLGLDGAWIRRRGRDGGYLRVTLPEVRFTIVLREGRRAVLSFAARLLGPRWNSCEEMEVEVDGVPVGRDRLTRRWSTHTFALPHLHRGPHEVRIRISADNHGKAWALRGVHVLRGS